MRSRKGKRYCNQELWDNRSDYLRLFGPIRQDSQEWESLYAQRQSVERVLNSIKESRRLERHSIRGLRCNGLHAAMSALSGIANCLVNLLAKEPSPRWMVQKVA